ncbi:MAG: DUF896 domain-containing protein [Ruminococcus sp.]|nr:DUF896 domain-containing protein [Ruminococcus sp.]
MDDKKIERINFLARKSRAEGLTDEEKKEQEALRNEYRQGIRANLLDNLSRIEFVDGENK